MRRLPWLLLPLIFMAIVWVVSRLSPNASGLGTHQGLGLPPCPLHYFTGIPCPACGLTTSWAHLLRGDWALAWQTHPLGPLFFLLLAMASGLSLLEFFGLKNWLSQFLNGKGSTWTLAGLGLFFGVWITRLLGIWGRP